MLRLTEVASQSVTFVKPALSKAKTKTVNSLNEMDGPSGHYRVVFSLDRPPLLAVMRDCFDRARAYLRVSESHHTRHGSDGYDPTSWAFLWDTTQGQFRHRRC